jgi:hypothetical protein
MPGYFDPSKSSKKRRRNHDEPTKPNEIKEKKWIKCEMCVTYGNKGSLPRGRLREPIWRKRHVTLEGQCFCCKLPITCFDFVCGHIVSKHDGGCNHVLNLEPICISCNTDMETQNLNEYIEDISN